MRVAFAIFFCRREQNLSYSAVIAEVTEPELDRINAQSGDDLVHKGVQLKVGVEWRLPENSSFLDLPDG